MSWVRFRTKLRRKDGALDAHIPISPLLFFSSASSPPLAYNGNYGGHGPPESSSGSKISPAILFVIIILAVVFFLSGILHLLLRYVGKRRASRDTEANRYNDASGSEAFQRQLQQLFHLHDSGLDQAFIDALPVFLYNELMVGLKEPFDCAVCLSEFSGEDKLRLLPMCSHAFHIVCIDTWLLSNSTCPLCRGSLYSPGITFENPVYDFEDQEEGEVEIRVPRNGEGGGNGISSTQKPGESSILNQKRVFSVRLGKFRSSNLSRVESGARGVGETSYCTTSSSNLDARRCFSMGPYQYVVSNLELQVDLFPNSSTGDAAVGSSSKLKAKEWPNGKSSAEADAVGKRISIANKGESFSVSKIWLWSKNRTPTAFPNSSGTRRDNNISVNIGFPLKDRTQNHIT